MASTIDSIAPGRFGINLVTGWQKAEYDQMGLWPGEQHYKSRYDYLAEYATVLKDLLETGVSDFKGDYFQMTDCRVSPHPQSTKIICAGSSDEGWPLPRNMPTTASPWARGPTRRPPSPR